MKSRIRIFFIYFIFLFSLLASACSLTESMDGDYTETAAALKIAGRTMDALRGSRYYELDEYIHPEKGVIFAPYSYVDYEEQQVLTAEQIKNSEKDNRVYNWGSIENTDDRWVMLTIDDYLEQYICADIYYDSARISVNNMIRTGSAIENLHEVFPDCIFVEYHYEGTKDFEYLDWSSVKVVLEKYEDSFRVVAIIHSCFVL